MIGNAVIFQTAIIHLDDMDMAARAHSHNTPHTAHLASKCAHANTNKHTHSAQQKQQQHQ